MGGTERLKQWIKESGRIVFFGGAGVSTESQIPDFRSQAGRNLKPQLLSEAAGGILPFLPE